VISDTTRPAPHRLLLQPILKRLDRLGVSRGSIKILIATGQHPGIPPEEFCRFIDPSWTEGIEVLCHHPSDHLIFIGRTSRGTPVWINRDFWESDSKILTGVIDPHQFVGFTGGAKMASIGLAGIRTIEANHSMLMRPESRVGEIEGNPVREDIDEMGARLGIDFILNVVLNEANHVVRAFAGHYLEAWREGVRLSRSIQGVDPGQKMDLVIASPGGYPKDIDLYQVQKGLSHAARIVKDGGTIILAGECSQGVGDDLFLEAVMRSETPEEVIEKFQSRAFRMGVHKAFLWCRALSEKKVYFYSGKMDPSLIRQFFLEPVSSVQEAISKALAGLPSNPRIAIMPKASSTFVIDSPV
jgi:nickel-dependent lactate racemase